MATTQAQVSYTASQIADMPFDQQQAVIGQLTSEDQKQVQQAIMNKMRNLNRQAMRKGIRQWVAMPVTGGNVTQATFTPGNTLSFDLPVVGGGYGLGVLVTVNLTVTPATGTGAAYQKNAAAPYNVFSEIDLFYNGSQIKSHPFIECKVISMLKGAQQGINNGVIANTAFLQDNATIDTNLVGACPITVGSGNSWLYRMFIPWNKLGKDTVEGIIPLNGIGTRGQFKLSCTPAMLGFDPLINPISTTAGTGAAVAVTGTVNCDILTLNGMNYDSPKNLSIDLTKEATLQTYWGAPLAPLTSGLLNRKQLDVLLEHWYVIAIVIDGVQSNTFTTLTNLQQMALTPDSTSNNALWHYNVSDNLSIYDYYYNIRDSYGQDLDIGVIPIVDGTSSNVVESSNRNGQCPLNMRSGGYPGANFAAYMGSVSSTNITPRVELFYISKNTQGLKLQA